jgi:hypothetical protein
MRQGGSVLLAQALTFISARLLAIVLDGQTSDSILGRLL